jgi:cyclase
MNCKRIIGTVIVKNNLAVQSMGFKNYLPLGCPLRIIENLNRWDVDEIIVKDIDASLIFSKPNYKLIEKIGNLGISTPISYAGGVSKSEEASSIIKMGFERIVVNQLFLRNDDEIIRQIAKKIGSQAIIISLPVVKLNKNIFLYNYINKNKLSFNNKRLTKLEPFYSELLIEDVKNEGLLGAFDTEILAFFKKQNLRNKFLLFGGITDPGTILKLLLENQVEGICIGNSLNYRENAVQIIKKFISNKNLKLVRIPHFHKNIL